MEILPNISLVRDISISAKKLVEILKELKGAYKKELYIYTCYYILSKIKNLLTFFALDFRDVYIKVNLLFVFNNKILKYMFFQNISKSCPYIII